MGFQYESDADYLLFTYSDKIEFARKQVASQLNHAKERQKGDMVEFKLFSLLGAICIVLFPLSIIMTMSGVFAVIGAILFILACPCTFFLLPVCLFKIIKHFVVRILNGNSGLAIYLKAKYGITTGRYEIDRLNELMVRYDAMLSNINVWKRESEEGELSLSEEEIRSKLERLDLNADIDVVNDESDFYKLTMKITAIVFVVFLGIIGFGVYIIFRDYIETLTYMFRQV